MKTPTRKPAKSPVGSASAPVRALVFDGQSPQLIASHPAPVADEGQAIIRLLKAGVAGLDLELCRGLFNFQGVIGREFVGVVDSVNSRSHAQLVGKRVVASPASSCGRCRRCQSGLSQHCRERTIMGLVGLGGCMADRFAVPAANLAVVPDAIDDDQAVFAVELASAIQTQQQLTIVNKPFITVLGDNSLGLLMAQVLGKLNASVRLIGWRPENLAICEKWGIKHRHADEIGRRGDQDIVVDCTGSADGLDLAMRLVRPRGKIVLKSIWSMSRELANAPSASADRPAGRGDDQRSAIGRQPRTPSNEPMAVDLSPIVLNEIEIIGSSFGPVGEALAMLSRAEVDVISLINRRMRLSDGPAILRTAAQPEVIKVIVEA